MEVINVKVSELKRFDMFKIGKQRNWRIVSKIIIPKAEDWEPKSFERVKDSVILILLNCQQYTLSNDSMVTIPKPVKLTCGECKTEFWTRNHQYSHNRNGFVCDNCLPF